MKTPQLKIAILGLHYAPEPSGNAPYTASLAEGLADKGHAVHVLTGFPHYPEWKISNGYRGWSMRETIKGIPVTRLRHHVPTRPRAVARLHMEFSFGVRLVFARWGDPDVVILVSPALFSTSLALIRARFSRKSTRTIVWVQDLYSRGIVETTGGRPSFASKAMARIEGKILHSAHAVVAIHERFARYIVSSLGVSSEAVKVVRNWTHLPLSTKVDRAKARAQFGWGDDEIIALHCGNMGKKQGLENVVEAARFADGNDSPVRFVLMGDGNQRESLMKAARGISRVAFVDSLPQQDFQSALCSADVLLVNELPGVRDMSVPSKLTSYFTSGVPVVAATDEGSVTSEEIQKAGAGIRVDAGDPSSLVSAIESIGGNPTLSSVLGENGRRYQQETLSGAAAVDHYDEVITSLALSRGR